ncbi:MAG TPA: hypothetical protein VGM90_14160 [Kofleriaceae bacterium]|jgi:hypothetical protein
MKAAIGESDQQEATVFVPSEEWIDAFERQSSAKGFEERLKRFARMRANMVARSGRRVDELYTRELVQDALDDTLEGILSWDPERVTLDKHLMDSIRSRTRHDFVHATRFPHASFDVNDAPRSQVVEVERALAAANDDAHHARVVSAAQRTVSELRGLAASDADVLRLLDAFEAEATKKVDVLRISGMTSKRYEAARKRMQRLVLQLSAETRDAIRA